ncbi:unnamed protein product [Linum tenue]|uniref:Uncharacterized protein n=1 Tax=Linum tenue TaxID=586396 RepID=A0AAV0LUW5_9ROSI|nr:unnamed protein product [Linum tenue]
MEVTVDVLRIRQILTNLIRKKKLSLLRMLLFSENTNLFNWL